MSLNIEEQSELDILMRKFPHSAEEKIRYDFLVDKALTWSLRAKILWIIFGIPLMFFEILFNKLFRR